MKLNERENEVLEVIEYLAWNIFLSQTITSLVKVSISIRPGLQTGLIKHYPSSLCRAQRLHHYAHGNILPQVCLLNYTLLVSRSVLTGKRKTSLLLI